MNILRNYQQGAITEITVRVENCPVDLRSLGFDVIPHSDNSWWARDSLAFLPKCTAGEAENELLAALQLLGKVPEGTKVLRIELSGSLPLQLTPEFLTAVGAAEVCLELG